MVEKLDLPFPLLSDPDRSLAIGPFDVVDESDPRDLARPAMIIVDPDGDEVYRFVSRDFADRLPEEEVLEKVQALGLEPTTQPRPTPGTPDPGERAVRLDALTTYFRGARFAILAFGLRHKDLSEELKQDSKAYVEMLDRYWEHVRELQNRMSQG